jgi:hypothetical protein
MFEEIDSSENKREITCGNNVFGGAIRVPGRSSGASAMTGTTYRRYLCLQLRASVAMSHLFLRDRTLHSPWLINGRKPISLCYRILFDALDKTPDVHSIWVVRSIMCQCFHLI